MERVPDSGPLGEQTVQRVLQALRDNRTACVAQVVELIREITARPDTISLHHLAELIERDVAVMAELLRIANTIGYNPEGVEIATVVQAIQVIGFTKIRNLAVSLLLLHNTSQTGNPQESREASALALATGCLAEVVFEALGDGREASEAFVCAALRQYGGLLLTTFLTEEHRQATALARTQPEAAAFHQIFGLTPLDLSRRVLESMGLPSGILGTFREYPDAGERKSMDPAAVQRLTAIDVAVEVSACLGTARRTASLQDVAASLQSRYGTLLDLRGPLLKEVLVEVDKRLRVLRGPLGAVAVLDRVRTLAGTDGGALQRTTGAPGPGTGPDTTRLLLDGIATVSDLLGASPVRGRQVFLAGARSVAAALGLVDCWVFRRHAAEAHFRPFVGSGPLFPQLSVRAVIDPSVRTVFSVCIERGEIVLITQPKDPKIRPYLPDWLIQVSGAVSLVLVPAGSSGEVQALLCGVAETDRLTELPAAVRQQLQVLARLLTLAREA